MNAQQRSVMEQIAFLLAHIEADGTDEQCALAHFWVGEYREAAVAAICEPSDRSEKMDTIAVHRSCLCDKLWALAGKM